MQSRLYISKLGVASIPRYASNDKSAAGWIASIRYPQRYPLIKCRQASQQPLASTRYRAPRRVKTHVAHPSVEPHNIKYTLSKNSGFRISKGQQAGTDDSVPENTTLPQDYANDCRLDKIPTVVPEQFQFNKQFKKHRAFRKCIIGKKGHIPIETEEFAIKYRANDKSLSTWGTSDIHSEPDQSFESTDRSHEIVRVRMSPQVLLLRWLQLDKGPEQHQLWISSRERFHRNHIPSILVEFLYNSSDPEIADDKRVSEHSKRTLKRYGFGLADLQQWSQILAIQDANQRVEMFLKQPSNSPVFMLEAILARGDVTRVKILDNIITYTLARIGDITPWQGASVSSRLLRTTNIQILCRLLYHARNTLASAIVTITKMLPPTVSALLGGACPEKTKLNAYMHRQLCDLFNLMLDQLALPASKLPFGAMKYAWEAQKTILGWASQFEPPLLLNQAGYRAVSRVLAAQKKSEKESRVASLSARTWPPWRVEQDGMDAQRVLEEDFSRVVSAVMRMSESGYHETPEDTSIKILGGQEADGTPTVHIRTIRKDGFFSDGMPFSLDDKLRWAARIEATRDVQEAWSAFTKFQHIGGKPGLLMYFVMFEKLQFEKARLEFDRTSYGSRRRYLDPTPGEGKELMPPSNDNVSTFYRMQLQPPTKDELYHSMVSRDGIRPTGSFLRFLVANARTPDTAIQYLLDGLIDPQAIEFLTDGTDMNPNVRKAYISDQLLAAFLKMLCRFVPRIDPGFQSQDRKESPFSVPNYDPSEILQLHTAPGKTIAPLDHSIFLLKQTRPMFRPAWYAVFRALARRGTIIDMGLLHPSQNDLLAWRVMEAVVHDFHNQGLELDPYGFLIICNGLEKAILASFNASNQDQLTHNSPALQFLATEFEKITAISTTTSTAACAEPLHDVAAAHLHAYVRVLGLVRDYEGILGVLEWMKEHHLILDERAQSNRNGYVMLKRTLVAMRVFTGGTTYRSQLEESFNSSNLWGGWPSEQDAEEYLERWETLPDDNEDVLNKLEPEQVLEEVGRTTR